MKKSMASILYHSLRQMGLRVFLDSGEFELGDHIPDKIQHAIRSSSVQIAILSENYAFSPWCLAELALMLKTDAKIVPVFYHVPPFVPRHRLGSYGEAFRQHELKGRYGKEQIDEWKAALHKASNIKGCELNDHNEDKGQLWKDIFDTVLKEVKRRSSLEVAEHPVGLKEAVGDFNRRRERENNPKLVGIVGMCGSGKTTLAAELFNVKRSAFDASCFLHDVCKTSAVNNLATLQRIILKRLLNLDLEIDSVSEGKAILKDRFAKVETTSRFLIILDGIDHNEQVDALLVQEVLRTNSLIIITSRHRKVFPSRPQAMLYEMKSMAEKHARELFCRHAFNQSSPVIGSENVVDGFMRQCDGLPLLLKEFGALLNGKSEKKEWEIELHNSFKRLDRDIKNKLQTSYDALDRDEREMFQDVSCFFIGHPKNTAIRIWNASGWSGDTGLQTLKCNSLIEVHHGGELSMRDLFKYLGRDVASDSTPAADQKFRRIWESAHINKLERQGFERVLRNGCNFRSFLHLPYSHGKQQLYENSRNKHSSAMNPSGRSSEPSKVHFFVGNDDLHLGGSRSSSDLLWLKWENCPHKCIPSWIPMESLRHLEVIDGDLEHLWQANSEGPLELTQLIIQRNPLTVLPRQFGCLTNLQHIDFHGCNQLEALPSSFSCLTQLQYLNLNNCESLRLEPCNLSFGQHLKTLHLLGTTVDEEVLNQIVKLSGLESLIVGSDSLKSLPSVKELSLLKILSIRKSEVEHLPEGIGELTNLQTLEVEDCPLTELTFTNSENRKFEGPETVNSLHSEWKSSIRKPMCMLSLENITLQHTKVRMITISGESCPSLKTLNLKENEHLVEFDLSLVSTLECLCLSGCSRLKRISGMRDLVKLKEFAISGCCELEDLPSLAPLTALERFTADQCWKLHNTGGVELLKGLKEFRFVADNGAIWNCFHGLQRFPSQEMILGGRAAAVAKLGDQEWINFSASDDPDGTTYVIGGDKIKLWGSLNTTSVVMIICFVIESFSENSWVRFWGFPGVLDLDGAVCIKAGEWIIASVFATEWKGDIGNLERFQVLLSKSPHYKLKKAFIAMVNKGGEDKITEFLNEIFVSKKDAWAPEQSEPNFKLQESVKVDNVLSYLIR